MTAIHSQNLTVIEQPFFDKKMGAVALVGVLALHGVVAVGLANMTIPEVKPPKVTPPLEITFITPPPPVEVKPEDIKIEPEPKPIEPKVEPVIPPKTEPNVEPKVEPKVEKKIDPKPVQKPAKPIEKTIEKPIEKPVEKPIEQPVQKPVEQPKPDPKVMMAEKLAQDNERAEQERQQDLARQKAEQQERDRKQAEAEAERKRADDEAKRKTKAETDAKAEKDRQDQIKKDKAQKDKEDAQRQQAQNNTPVTFSASEVTWRKEPAFNCNNSSTSGESLNFAVKYTINKQGKITNATVVKSSGDFKVDREFQRQAMGGSFNPVIRNGMPAFGTATLPMQIQCN